jgi:flagellar biosynthesis protein FlhF
MEALYQPNAMENALSRHRTRDGICIDTAGRSPLDTERLEELASFIDAANPDEVLLCLSATTRFEDQLEAISHYSILKPTGIIFTKLDEVNGFGGILNILTYQALPLTVLTCGQNVPDDIVHPNPEQMAHLILHPNELVDLQKQRFSNWVKGENSAKRQETLVGN